MVISAIGGAAGVRRFPGGRLHVNLDGFDVHQRLPAGTRESRDAHQLLGAVHRRVNCGHCHFAQVHAKYFAGLPKVSHRMRWKPRQSRSLRSRRYR
jgi:hypothetical protein